MMHSDDSTAFDSDSGASSFKRVRELLSEDLRMYAVGHDKLLLEGRWVTREIFEQEMKKARRRSWLAVTEVLLVALAGIYAGGLVLGLLAMLLGPF